MNGVVVDTQGGFIPGATIEIKNTATGVTETLVSNANGAFSTPALSPGLYTVTVSLNGFKTYVLSDVRLVAATPAQIKTVLELGALTETVEVKGGANLVQTTSATVQSTMLAEQITKLPLVSRNGLSSVMFLPGVEQTGGYRDCDDQRPAAEHHQPHARRDRDRQQPAVQRRLLHAGVPAPGRDRRSDRHRRDARRRQRRAGVGAGRVRHPVGQNQFDRSIYHY